MGHDSISLIIHPTHFNVDQIHFTGFYRMWILFILLKLFPDHYVCWSKKIWEYQSAVQDNTGQRSSALIITWSWYHVNILMGGYIFLKQHIPHMPLSCQCGPPLVTCQIWQPNFREWTSPMKTTIGNNKRCLTNKHPTFDYNVIGRHATVYMPFIHYHQSGTETGFLNFLLLAIIQKAFLHINWRWPPPINCAFVKNVTESGTSFTVWCVLKDFVFILGRLLL